MKSKKSVKQRLWEHVKHGWLRVPRRPIAGRLITVYSGSPFKGTRDFGGAS